MQGLVAMTWIRLHERRICAICLGVWQLMKHIETYSMLWIQEEVKQRDTLHLAESLEPFLNVARPQYQEADKKPTQLHDRTILAATPRCEERMKHNRDETDGWRRRVQRVSFFARRQQLRG